MSKKIQKLQQRIVEIKKQLSDLGPMRPGKLSKQSRKDRNGKEYGSYWKLGYTYKMKVKSEYIPDQLVEEIQRQNEEFKRFKTLTEEWIDLALQVGQIQTEQKKNLIKKGG
jgi:hypothetical protein